MNNILINYLAQHNMLLNRDKINYNEYKKLGHSGAIITCRNKILLVQGRKTSKWSLPKGHSFEGETPISCAIREVREETGIHLNTYDFCREAIKLRVSYYFFVELPFEYPINPLDNDEILSYGWFSYDQLIHNSSMILNVDANRFFGFLKSIMNPTISPKQTPPPSLIP